MEVHLDTRGADARLRVTVEVHVWIDRLDARDLGWVVLQVHPRAEADLEDAPARRRERALPRAAQHPARHRDVEQAGEDAVVVEAQVAPRGTVVAPSDL
jgi:hypothetical protein